MSKQSLEARVAVLERAVGSALGFSLEQFDPAAQEAKRQAEAKAAEEKAVALEAEAKAIEDAQIVARHREEAEAKAAEDARIREAFKAAKK